ncbi:MAG: HAMP domain-containing protein [Proteobacteria bacterium]|nr:MAG: HAMP domain-containing protein [Pseudomonadota bacterium]
MSVFPRWRSIRTLVRTTLRYKLLLLVLFPTLLAMPATLGLTIYWFNSFTRDNLFLKVKSDLAVTRHAFGQMQQDHATALQRLTDSYSFRLLLTNGDARGLQNELKSLIDEEGFTFVHLTDELGNWLYEESLGSRGSSKPSPLTNRAMRGRPSAALEVFTPDDLQREDPALIERMRVPLADEPERAYEDRTMVMRAVYPIRDFGGQILALLDGGIALNRNNTIIEELRDRVYGPATLPSGGVGAIALLLDNVRIGTNLTIGQQDTALGTYVSTEIRDKVLGEGSTWVARDLVGQQWYISAYQPVFDADGQGIGMLQSSILEAPFRNAHYRAAALLLLIFIGVIALATWVVLRGARSIFKPIEQMANLVRATQAGVDRRMGKIDSQDEIGELAVQFDSMLDLLQRRNHEISRAAEQLEAKVEDRTRELEQKNTDLERTVSLLRETRQQLVMAEKLASLGQMAAGIAHEINNPTAVIIGNLDLLVAELGDAANSVHGEVDMIIQQVDRIRYIVDGLLQFARPSSPSDNTDIENVNINRTVKDTLVLVRHAVEKGETTVHVQLDATRTVRIRRYELQEVLINLLLNAARAVSAGGVIEVITADWEQQGVVISVKDNGVGIAPEKLGRVFDPFYTTDTRHGTGLGLSVSYGLIRRYGGEITVESELHRGSVFQVWLLEEPVLADQRVGAEDFGENYTDRRRNHERDYI